MRKVAGHYSTVHWAALALAVCLCITFLLLAALASKGDVLAADQAFQRGVRQWRQPALDYAMRIVSALGSGSVLIPLNVLVVYLLWQLRYRNVLLVPLISLTGVVIEGFTKWIIHRPRPKNVGYGFPSGHVFGAIIVFGLLVYLLWRSNQSRRRCVAATGIVSLVVMGIAFSRLYLNAHWLSDVLGGIAGGVALLVGAVLSLGARLCDRAQTDDSTSVAHRAQVLR